MEGSRNSYTGLPEELTNSIRTVIGGLVKDGLIPHDDVDDFEQELALRGWSALARYRPESGVPLAFFLGNAIRQRAISLLRLSARCQRNRRLLTGQPPGERTAEPQETPHEALILSIDLRETLARLPKRQRRILELLKHHSVAGAAQELGVSRGGRLPPAHLLLRIRGVGPRRPGDRGSASWRRSPSSECARLSAG